MSKHKEKRKWYLLTSSIILLVVMGSCFFLKSIKNAPEKKQLVLPVEEPVPIELSAWLVDWHWPAGIEDAKGLSKSLTSLQLFAAYFNHDGELLLTHNFKEMLPKYKESIDDSEVFMTIVNDRIQLDGTSVQKDPDLISQLVGSEESRSQHIHKIIEMVDLYQLAGVEIDYEKVTDNDWNNLIAFYRELYSALEDKGKKLRIVLETKAPLESLHFPEGPVYVMMAYNLYGTHSGPGPKADPALISNVAEKLSHLSGKHYIALSAGGFDWREDGKITSLTEEKAIALSTLSSKPPERDEESGSLSFEYVDDTGMKHTVWYGDYRTIKKWIEAAKEAGITKIALWRLGEINQKTIDVLMEY
ncbi:glycosyl hydrolase family 18 protein [Bacillus sp. EB106-08-02-XG196]|uniref:glycosyl hydrolase family 18 protein n=1 Tax=Bacillus sp. EB106-08-02-XG196 TaxID=2737049 RepID=UPI0034D180F6